jgi:hypothetical protein
MNLGGRRRKTTLNRLGNFQRWFNVGWRRMCAQVLCTTGSTQLLYTNIWNVYIIWQIILSFLNYCNNSDFVKLTSKLYLMVCKFQTQFPRSDHIWRQSEMKLLYKQFNIWKPLHYVKLTAWHLLGGRFTPNLTAWPIPGWSWSIHLGEKPEVNRHLVHLRWHIKNWQAPNKCNVVIKNHIIYAKFRCLSQLGAWLLQGGLFHNVGEKH